MHVVRTLQEVERTGCRAVVLAPRFHIECIRQWYVTCHERRTEDEMLADPCAIDLRNPCPVCAGRDVRTRTGTW